MARKQVMITAKGEKTENDEFYTQLVDIESELQYYKNHFKGKSRIL